MKGLLLKDLYLLKELKKFLILVIGLSVFISMGGGQESTAAGYMSVMSVIIVMNSISYDDYNKGYAFLMTLPISKKDYVTEKYGYGLLIAIAGLGLGIVLAVGRMIFAKSQFSFPEWMEMWGFLLSISMITLSVMLPFAIKYGSEKGRMALIIVLLVVFCVIMLGTKLFDGSKGYIVRTIGQLMDSGYGVVFALVIAAAAMAVSYTCSVKIMEKKEF